MEIASDAIFWLQFGYINTAFSAPIGFKWEEAIQDKN